uniref:Uncharacterized protein n=1 Tax=Branchiostoma floridae TaxID=7739 RepID=C3ZTS4_BRAFL|eukprot:XP_002588061.1 hypothetical protein BRAFLDRAFT_83052 [Branchiostoma floridae]
MAVDFRELYLIVRLSRLPIAVVVDGDNVVNGWIPVDRCPLMLVDNSVDAPFDGELAAAEWRSFLNVVNVGGADSFIFGRGKKEFAMATFELFSSRSTNGEVDISSFDGGEKEAELARAELFS